MKQKRRGALFVTKECTKAIIKRKESGVQEFRSSGVQEFRSRHENPECEEEDERFV